MADQTVTARVGSRGYIMVMLLAIIVGMGILLTAALPNLSTENQREQEAELVYRGEALATAIRTYRAKTGSYPLKLEDLIKVRPPLIRKIYTDPMTQDGEWDLITAVQPGASGDTTGLPIVGVRSRCQKDSFRIYQGKTLISDWSFSSAGNLLGSAGAAAGALSTAAALTGAASGTTTSTPPKTPTKDAPTKTGDGTAINSSGSVDGSGSENP